MFLLVCFVVGFPHTPGLVYERDSPEETPGPEPPPRQADFFCRSFGILFVIIISGFSDFVFF